jgi:hypothetical protein
VTVTSHDLQPARALCAQHGRPPARPGAEATQFVPAGAYRYTAGPVQRVAAIPAPLPSAGATGARSQALPKRPKTSPPHPVVPVVQRVITPKNKTTIGTLSRSEVIARMRNPPGEEEAGEIATAYLVAQGYADHTDGQFRQWVQLIRDSVLAAPAQPSSIAPRSDSSSSTRAPSASSSAAATTPVHDLHEEKKEAAPTGLTTLAKNQLAAAEAKHNEKNSQHKLQAPTMGVGRYRAADGSAKRKTSNQRNLPGTKEQALADGLDILPSLESFYGNMHAEMAGVYHWIDATIRGTSARLEEMGASQEICFLCEIVMTTLGVAYDAAHISKRLYPKWEDPTGKFKPGETFLTMKAALKTLGVPEKEAKERLVARLSKEMGDAQAEAFATRILAGELQTKKGQGKLLRDLKAVPKIAAANQRKGGGGRARASSSKQGRRIKRELAKARKAAAMASSSKPAEQDDESARSSEQELSGDVADVSD